MRILYGIVGEGMGHATRSRVVIEHLLRSNHQVRVVVSGRAHRFLTDCFAERERVRIDEIHGLHLAYDGNAVDRSESLFENLEAAPEGVLKNIAVYRKVAEDGFRPEVVISDFESWAYLYGLNHRVPVISIDNMQVINRCRHEAEIVEQGGFDLQLAKLAVKVKLPGAYHYLATSFFFPPVRKKRTTLVPPILRPEILAARREPSSHVLVYQTASANEALVPLLQRLPYDFRVYGMGREGSAGNVTLRPFSQEGFVDDLRTARAVIAGGGFSLMGEAVHLHVPMMSVPIEKQYEQELNARYLEALGYGAWSPTLDAERIETFLGNSDAHAAALEAYAPQGNELLFGCVDELLDAVQGGVPRPHRLQAPSMGSWPEEPEEHG